MILCTTPNIIIFYSFWNFLRPVEKKFTLVDSSFAKKAFYDLVDVGKSARIDKENHLARIMMIKGSMKKVSILIGSLFFLLLLPLQLLAETRVLVLGDSLAAGYGLEPEKAFPVLVEEELTRGGYAVKVINAGSSGSTSASARQRIKWYLRSKPDIMLLELGNNDGLRGLDIQKMRKNLGDTIQIAQKNGIRVLLAGLQIPPNYGKQYTENFKQSFPKLAKEYQIPMIPFLLDGVAGDPSLNLADGIHPNEKGHRIICKTVIKYLKPMLDEKEIKYVRRKK